MLDKSDDSSWHVGREWKAVINDNKCAYLEAEATQR